MSELIHTNDNRTTIRWKLLTGVSALALTAYVSSASVGKAEDANRPAIWIELDGQFAQQKSDDEAFIPSFMLTSPFDGASQLGKNSPTIWNKGATISFQPSGTDWVLSAGIQYGKSSRHKFLNQITPYLSAGRGTRYAGPGTQYNAYQIVNGKNVESRTILDFQVGKDVGLGMFGGRGSSVISAGVRYAQFNSLSNSDISSKPTNAFRAYYRYYSNSSMTRKFAGIGPSLSWDASANIAGNPSDGAISLDWGVNAAVLFGRQQVHGHHESTKVYRSYYSGPIDVVGGAHASPSRSKSVTVPNLGGFAAMSWRISNAKISFGYRADIFFGAMDRGIDVRKDSDLTFNGPYASISVGLGD